MINSELEEMREVSLEKARKHLRSVGRDPGRLEGYVDLLGLDADKKTLDAAISLLDHPLSDELIEVMIPLIAYPNEGIRCFVFSRIAITLKHKGTDFYVRCLQEPKFRDKSQPIYRLYRYGGESAVPAVAKRLRQILNTRKASPYHYHNGETELTHCLDFLHRYRDRKEVLPVLNRMIEKWEILSDKEVYWITDQLEYFDHIDLRRGPHCMPAVVKFVDSDHPVFEACENGDVVELRKILQSGVSVYSNDTDRNPVGLAIKNGHLEILKLLVEFGLNLERPTHGFHEFPIIKALSLEKWDIANHILNQGIDINRRDQYGRSIFKIVCWGFAPADWVARMIEMGADVNDKFRGETPIFSAVRGEATAVMELLTAHGADVNAIDNDGDSPLICAARGGKSKSASWLIEHGADLRHCQYRDRDALYWARENKHPEVEALFMRALDRK